MNKTRAITKDPIQRQQEALDAILAKVNSIASWQVSVTTALNKMIGVDNELVDSHNGLIQTNNMLVDSHNKIVDTLNQIDVGGCDIGQEDLNNLHVAIDERLDTLTFDLYEIRRSLKQAVAA
jgi:hypothetical protein